MKGPAYILIFLATAFLCGCHNGKDSGERFPQTLTGEISAEAKPIGPVTEPTQKELVQSTEDMLAFIKNSLQQMQDAAGAKDAPAKGVKAAQKVRQKYEPRLKELANTDLSALSSEELVDLSLELSDIITAIREARDQLAGI